MPTLRTNNSAEYHRQRRINEPTLYRERGREYSARYREKKKKQKLEEQEKERLEKEVLEMTVEDLADLIIDNEDSDPGEPPSGVI